MTVRLPKKILALLLSVCLILPTLSAAASAAETDTGRTEITGMTGDTAQPTITEEAALSETVFQLDADCRILSYVDEAVFREADHIARLNEEETLSTYVFLNRDGTKTVYYMDEEVKYLDSDGTVREKDLSLTADLNGYTTAQNDISLTLPENLSEGVGLSYAGYDISLIPQITTARVTGPQVNGNAVGYQNCFGNGTVLVYTPTLSGLKEDIVLVAYTGVSSFEFLLNTDGLGLYQEDGRYYLSASPTAELRIRLGDIVAFDATGSFSVGSMAVTTITERQQYRLTVSVDPAFLADPNTVYPVSIDPSITVSDNTHGAGAIEDASIYQGAPTLNTGSWPYAHCGYVDSTYKVGRILIRPKKLLSDSTYQSVSASQIESAYFYIWETSGTSAQTINLYSLSGSTSWTESGVTWHNAGVTQGSKYASASPGSNAKASFNITSLVKAWKNNQATANCGFMLTSSNETSVDKAFCTSEYETTSTRPYVVVNYNSTDGSLNYTSTDVDEGATKTLTLSGVTGTVTWSSSNTAVATVSSSGVVTGVKAGVATITASAPGYTSKTCTVFVTIPDGVYRISMSSLPIGTSGSIASTTSIVTQATASTNPGQLYQMWKIKHLGSGYYSIRPYYKLNMALGVVSGSLKLLTDTNDTISSISSAEKWKIVYTSNGSYFKQLGSTSAALTVSNGGSYPGLSVYVGTYSASSTVFHWNLSRIQSPPSGVLLFDTTTNAIVNSVPMRYLALQESKTLANLNLAFSIYSASSTPSQRLSWASGNECALVNSSTGQVTGASDGTTTITGSCAYGSVQIRVNVLPVATGTYFLKNKKTNRYADIQNGTMAAETQIEQRDLDGSNSQRWIFTHQGDGTFTIHSANSSTKYYLGVKDDSTANDQPVVLRTGSLTNGMKWKVSGTASGAYKLTPLTGEANGRVLAVGWYVVNTNGIDIEQRDYVADDNYKDEWLLSDASLYFATVNNYFDNGYSVYYSENTGTSTSKVSGYMNAISNRYHDLFSLEITYNGATYYSSPIDNCKGTVTSSNIDTLCNHSGLWHTDRNNVISAFQSAYTGDSITTNVLWSCHLITSTATNGDTNYNRSCSAGTAIIMIERSSLLQRDTNSKGVLMHELNHQFGAVDHYHELRDKNDPTSCKFKDICSECGAKPRPSSCIMYQSRIDISNEDVICDACKQDILAHLLEHHAKY